MNTALATAIEPDQRMYERLAITLMGRCMFANGLEIPCQAVNISPGDATFVASHVPAIGETMIVYLDQVGRLEGTVSRLFDNGFAILIKATQRRREKLQSTIVWVKQHQDGGLPDNRVHQRVVPERRNSEIELLDGRTYPIKIIDISLSGAAVEVAVRPAVGAKIKLAGLEGHVVRHFNEGIAIQFTELTTQSALGKTFT